MNPYEPYCAQTPPDLQDRFWTDGVRHFVFIPKNASSTITDALKPRRWNHLFERPEEGTFFGVARDPVDRWVSGIVQVFHHIGDVVKRLQKDIGPFVDQPWYDQHTSPQVWYYRDLENPRIYKIENLEAMWQWLEIPMPGHKNATAHKPMKRELSKRIWEQMTPEYEAKLREFYKDDQALYEAAL